MRFHAYFHRLSPGSPGTRRIPMNRVAGLLLAGLVLLLGVTLTQSQLAHAQDPICPASGEPSVECDASGNCFHHCCLSFGVWRLLCIAQIEHKRISVYARSANQSVQQKGYPLAQAQCTAFAQTAGLCVWFAPASAQATMAACVTLDRCAGGLRSTAQNHRQFVSPHCRGSRPLEWGGHVAHQSLDG